MSSVQPERTKIAIAGALGRTGRSTVEAALADSRFEVVAALTVADSAGVGTTLTHEQNSIVVTDTLADCRCDVLIDFSAPGGTLAWLRRCVALGMPFVTGVTNLSTAQMDEVREAAQSISIVQSANFSVGIAMLRRLVGQTASALGGRYDVEIVETHHRDKVDAPSGTAWTILDAIRNERRHGEVGATVFGRHGATGPRANGEIGMHSIRMGEVIGQHEVHFSGPGETITIRHTSHSRATYAHGALHAARWLAGRSAGYYTLDDVFDIS